MVGDGWDGGNSGPAGGVGVAGNNGWWRILLWVVVVTDVKNERMSMKLIK